MFNPEGDPREEQEEKKDGDVEEGGEKSIEIRAGSVASDRHPDVNEDVIFYDTQAQAFGVFDGMGGYAAGEIASQIAKEQVEKGLAKLPEQPSFQEVEQALKEVLEHANEAILEYVKKNPEHKGMGSTASLVYLLKEGETQRAIIGNVGDGRVYVLHADGVFEQVTLDDNIVRRAAGGDNQYARELQGRLNNAEKLDDLNEEERALFNQRNKISHVLGRPDIEPRIHDINIRSGDKILVSSDGIHDNLTDKEIAAVLAEAQDNSQAVERLIAEAQNRSRDKRHIRAKADDMSAIVVGSAEAPRQVSLSEAVDFLALYEALDAKGGIQGSKESFSAQKLKQVIDQIREGKLPLESVTRASGLRQRVKALLNVEQGKGYNKGEGVGSGQEKERESDVMRVSLDEVVERYAGATVRWNDVESFDFSDIRYPDYWGEFVKVETTSHSTYYFRKQGDQIEVFRQGEPRKGVATGEVVTVSLKGAIRKDKKLATDQFTTSPVTKITHIEILDSDPWR